MIYDGPLMHAATRWLIHCLFIWYLAFFDFPLMTASVLRPDSIDGKKIEAAELLQHIYNYIIIYIYDNYIIKIITYFIISQLYRFISMLQIYRYKYTTYPYIIASKYKSYNNIIYIIMFIYYISLYIIYCSGTLCYISLDAITSYLYVESWQVIFFYTRWIELGWQANWNWWHILCFVVEHYVTYP